MKHANQSNVDYLQSRYNRNVSCGEKIITVEYDYPYAMAIAMGSNWNRFVYRHFVKNFAIPRLYQQTLEGMEAWTCS